MFTRIHLEENVSAVSWNKMCLIFYLLFLSDTKACLAARKLTELQSTNFTAVKYCFEPNNIDSNSRKLFYIG